MTAWNSCDVLLALIGPSWLDSKDAAGKRRLDDSSDFVRQEIATALKRNIPVTPVLLQRAQMPAEQSLPDDLKDLAFRNGFELSHTRWRSDVREMVQKLGLGSAAAAPSEARLASPAKSIALDQPPAIRSAAPPEVQHEVSGMPRGRLGLTRRGALGASAAAVAVGTVAISAPYIRRWASAPPRPALKTIAFDYATVDEKGARMRAERASMSIFTETLGASVGLDMVSIPPGVFTMGSPKYEPERRANESPQHSVTSGRFFIGAFPVTQAQWAAVVTAHPAKLAYGLDPYPSFFKGDDLPVESIAWNQANEFCRRLAEMMRRDYQGPPNRFGLYEMHGNVWEYCLDAANPTYADAPADGGAYCRGRWGAIDPARRLVVTQSGDLPFGLSRRHRPRVELLFMKRIADPRLLRTPILF